MSDSESRPARITSDSRTRFNDDLFTTLLADRGLSSNPEYADHLGLTACSVRRYRNGQVVPLLTTARRIAAAVGTGVDDLWPVTEAAA